MLNNATNKPKILLNRFSAIAPPWPPNLEGKDSNPHWNNFFQMSHYVKIIYITLKTQLLPVLGSSAPEILLSVIEICGNNFEAGDLGPSTIVGSAAFNLFIIIAICIYVWHACGGISYTSCV